MSGIIFVVLALAWAVYLIPKALKHHDEIARTRSIDRFSTAMRVLARREPVNRRDSRLVVTPARPADFPRMLVPGRPAGQSAAAVAAVVASAAAPQTDETVRRQAVAPTQRRAAARAAARRRRHILIFLLAVDLGVVGVAAFALLPWWSVAIPVVLTLVYLVLCRRQVSRANDALWTPDDESGGTDTDVAPRRAIRVEAPYGTPRSSRNDQGFDEVSPDEDTVAISAVAVSAALDAASAEEADLAAARVVAVETVAVSVPTVDGGSLWDPLPVTLPTYVGKSRAARTVRTIDLSEPGTWSSGRSEADSKLVDEATAAQEDAATGQDDQRAVGS